MRIAVFHPTNIVKDNAFDVGEAPAYDFLSKNFGYQVELFVEEGEFYPRTKGPILGTVIYLATNDFL